MEFDFYTRHFTRKYHKKKKPGEFLWDLCKDYQVNAQFFFNGMGNLPMTKMQFSFYAFRQVGKKMDRKSGLLSNIDFLFNQPTIETYCNNAGNIVCQYVLSKYYEN